MTYTTRFSLDEDDEEILPRDIIKPSHMTLYAWQLMINELISKHGPNAMLDTAVIHSDLGRDFTEAGLWLSPAKKPA
jgi:hypothetical protein